MMDNNLDFSFVDEPAPVKTAEAEIIELSEPALSIEQQLSVDKAKPDFEVIEKEISAMITKAKDIRVVDESTNIQAQEMLIQLRGIANKITLGKKSNILYKAAALFKNEFDRWLRESFTIKLDAMEKLIKPKVNAYARQQAELQRRIAQKKAAEEAAEREKEVEKLREEIRQRQEKERKEALALQVALDAEAALAGVESVIVEIPEVEDNPDIPLDMIITPIIDNTPDKVKIGGTGTSTIKMVWNFKIVDASKIPKDYLIVNEKMIKDAIKNHGIRSIAGVEIFEEPDTSVRLSKGAGMSSGEF